MMNQIVYEITPIAVQISISIEVNVIQAFFRRLLFIEQQFNVYVLILTRYAIHSPTNSFQFG